MSASTSPRLGLALPVASDAFNEQDFYNSFSILDGLPGIKPVANYNAVAALNWGTAQHGSTVLQLDNGALWYWNNPSGSGYFKRINTLGVLKSVDQPADVTSTATTGTGTLIMQTGNMTLPGGRRIELNTNIALSGTSGQSAAVHISYTDNGSVVQSFNIRAGLSLGGGGIGSYQNICAILPIPTANSTHNYGVYIRSTASTVANGGGGTSSAFGGNLAVKEL